MRWHKAGESAFNVFWSPVFQSLSPVLICIADQNQDSSIVLQDAADPDRQIILNDRPAAVAIDDTVPLLSVGGILQSHQRLYRVKGQAATTLADLRQGSDVLIGAFDNGWTLRLTQPLRFHFVNNPQMLQLWIEDRQKGTRWVRDLTKVSDNRPYIDYAIVARYLDPMTNNVVVVAAG
jgi:hypothetical protein